MAHPLPRAHETSPAGPQIIGHRGARGLVVENTLDSFARALDLGAAGVELDVLLSADGVPVVWHDPVLLPEKLGAGSARRAGTRITDLTVEELRAVDVAGATLPEFPRQEPATTGIATLAEALAAILDHPTAPWVLLEIKSVPDPPGYTPPGARLTEAALDVLDALAVTRGRARVHERIVLESFDWACLDVAERRDPRLARAALAVEPGADVTHATVYPGSPWLGPVDLAQHADALAAIASLGVRAVTPYFAWVLAQPDPAAWVRRAHDLGLAVLPWTVNEPDAMRALADAGVEGIVTDVPDVALAILG